MGKKQDKVMPYELEDLESIYDQEYIELEFKSELNEWREDNESSDYRTSY